MSLLEARPHTLKIKRGSEEGSVTEVVEVTHREIDLF